MIRRPPRSTRLTHSFPTRRSSDLLDLTGPFEIFARMPGAAIDLVSKTMEPVHTDRGLILTPTATFADRPDPDILFVPGGPGQLEAMEDAEIVGYLRQAGAQAKLVTRSEEHTSELQSLMRISYAVFCLKKKNTNNNHRPNREQHY